MKPFFFIAGVVFFSIFSACTKEKIVIQKETIVLVEILNTDTVFVVDTVHIERDTVKKDTTKHFFCNCTEYTSKPYTWQTLPNEQLPYYNKYVYNIKNFFFDKDSVVLYLRDNLYSYHPVYIALSGFKMINNFRLTKDSLYLRLAKKNALKLVQLSKRYKGGLYYPYFFNTVLHSDDPLIAPWYSGMAQGQILSLLSRLYQFTGEERFKSYADSTFKSFTNIQYNTNPWVTAVDTLGNFWIEEYPVPKPDLTLNGFVFAIYGLYDYYRINPTPESEKLLNAATYTIEKNILDYRNPGGISYYCKKHKVKSASYHQVHIDILKQLALMSNQNYFNEVATLFEQDYKP